VSTTRFLLPFVNVYKTRNTLLTPPPALALQKPTFEPHPAAKDNNDDAVARAANSWRRMLVSPLLGFLTDIRNGEWVQLAGHMDSFLPGRAGTICKKSCDMEKEAYEGLCVVAEPLREFTPLYFSEVEMVEGEHYLELQDLLAEFKNPCVMDVKMGVRTFLESEVAKKTTRMDLLGKMMKLDPDEPSEDEKANGITKLRYMEFREKLSSSRNLGFRIEGIKLGEDPPINTFKTKKERDEVAEVITTEFLPSSAPMRRKIVQTMHGRLLDLKDALGESKFFYTHELVGSSLLFVYDERGEAGIWMIDFGKTKKVRANCQVPLCRLARRPGGIDFRSSCARCQRPAAWRSAARVPLRAVPSSQLLRVRVSMVP